MISRFFNLYAFQVRVKLRLFPQLMEVFEEEDKPPFANIESLSVLQLLISYSHALLPCLLISFCWKVFGWSIGDNSFIYLSKLYLETLCLESLPDMLPKLYLETSVYQYMLHIPKCTKFIRNYILQFGILVFFRCRGWQIWKHYAWASCWCLTLGVYGRVSCWANWLLWRWLSVRDWHMYSHVAWLSV